MCKKITTESFIEKAKGVYDNKYVYDLVKYSKLREKVIIICKTHGEFEITPESFIKKGVGCPRCNRRLLTTKDIINEFEKIHGKVFDYSKVKYINRRTKIIIGCKKHGYYSQTFDCHKKWGCPKCRKEKKHLTTEQFIFKANQIHGNKYNYDEVNYIKSNLKIKIYCNECKKIFYQTPNGHLNKRGCIYCAKQIMDTNLFIEKSKQIFDNNFDYSETIYINMLTKVKIKCKKHNFLFSQNPHSHLNGSNGCPICKDFKGEILITKFLLKNNIEFIQQKGFKNCKNIKSLRYDFYLPQQKILIEYHGEQHYKPVLYFGGENKFKIQKNNDKIKEDYAKINNFNLIIIPYIEFNNIDKILKDKLL